MAENLKFNKEEIKATRKAMYDKFKADKSFMKSLEKKGVTEEMIWHNVGLLNDYFDSLQSVEKCRQAGRCINEDKHHALTLEVTPPFIAVERHLCPMYLESQDLFLRFSVRDFPDSYLDLHPKDLKNQDRENFADYIKELFKLMNGKTHLIYAYGLPGIGKLQGAVPFVKKMLEMDKTKTAGVVNFPAFVSNATADYFNNKETVISFINHYIDLDILVLDNFGNETVNQIVIEAIIFPLLSARIRQKKSTIIIAGLNLDGLRGLYAGRGVRGNQIVDLIVSNINEEIYLGGTPLDT